MFVCFAPPRGAYGSKFNRLIAWLTRGKFCHVAIVFECPLENGATAYVECSVVSTGPNNHDVVHFSEVEDMEGWTCFRLTLDNPACEIEAYNYVFHNLLKQVYSTADSIIEAGLCCLPCIKETQVQRIAGEKTYCSKLAMEILHRVGQFLKHPTVGTSPNDIHRLIQSSKDQSGKWTDVTQYSGVIFKQNYAQPRIYVATGPGPQDMMIF